MRVLRQIQVFQDIIFPPVNAFPLMIPVDDIQSNEYYIAPFLYWTTQYLSSCGPFPQHMPSESKIICVLWHGTPLALPMAKILPHPNLNRFKETLQVSFTFHSDCVYYEGTCFRACHSPFFL